jgi:flagellar protein FlaF
MGFSTSGAVVVLLVGLLVAGGVFFSAVDTGADRVSESATAAADRTLAQRNTDVTVGNATYDGAADTLAFDVENPGARAVAVEELTVLVDGRYVTPTRTAVDGAVDNTVLAPGQTLRVRVDTATTPGRVKVVTGPGVAAVTTEVEVN